MVSVVGFVFIILYIVSFIFFYSINRLKQFKWIMFNASIIISIFFALGTAILSFSFIELSMLLYDFTAVVTMVIYRERYVNKKAVISMGILLIIIMLSLSNLIFYRSMPKVILMDTKIDDVFLGIASVKNAAFTESNLHQLMTFLFMIIGLLFSTEYFKNSYYIEKMFNIVKKAFYVFFVFATVEFIINNLGYVQEFRNTVLNLIGNYEYNKVYTAQNRFGYYGVTTFFPEQSYVSLMIIFLCISYIKGLRSNKDILWYIYGIAVIFMFGCTTSLMLVPFAVFIYIKEVVASKSKVSNGVKFFKIFILVVSIVISICIIFQNYLLVSEAVFGTVDKLSAYIIGGMYNTSSENSASIRNFGNEIALKAFAASPLFGVGIGTTRGYGIISGLLANFGLLGVISYFAFLNNIFNFKIKKEQYC